jgi:hypothetical protein
MPWVHLYVRSDGTPVRGHSRSASGAKRETMIFGFVALALVGLSNSNVPTSGGEGTPRPHPTVSYPIRVDNVPPGRPPEPRPTVSYPIRWER